MQLQRLQRCQASQLVEASTKAGNTTVVQLQMCQLLASRQRAAAATAAAAADYLALLTANAAAGGQQVY
jgi:hypothetical protein